MPNEENGAVTQNEGQQEEAKTYTQEEVDALLQKETDRRVTSALKKQEEKSREAEKLARMNEREKYEYQLQQKEAELEKREKALILSENKAAAAKILAEDGLQDLTDMVVCEDAETMNANIKALKKAMAAAVKTEVEKRLSGRTPGAASKPAAQMTRENFAKMSLAEQQRLYDTDRALYDEMTS